MNNAKAKRKLWYFLHRTSRDPGDVTIVEYIKAFHCSMQIGKQRQDLQQVGLVTLGTIKFANGIELSFGPGALAIVNK